MKPSVANYKRPLNCVRIVPVEAPPIYLAEYPFDIAMSNGQVYQSAYGYEFTGMQLSATLAPSAVDLTGFVGVNGITKAQIESGIFTQSRVYVFVTDWASPEEDEEPRMAGLFGKVKMEDDRYIVEMMTLLDLLGQQVGKSFPPLCPLQFGGEECGVDAVSLRVTATITSVTDQYTFTASTLLQDDDYFGAGQVWFEDGSNQYVSPQRVKSFGSGVIGVTEPFPYMPEVGDEITIEPGCRKRLQEDCISKYDNAVNHLGFPFVPGQRFLNSYGDK